jgi:alpha-tubulin suppressor-like RCC1 family protein
VRPWLAPVNRAVPGISDWKNVQIYGEKNFFDRTGKEGEYCDYDPGVMRGHGIKKGSKYWVAEPWPVAPVTTHDAKEAYRLVLAQSGCLPRDAVSKRTFREVRTGAGYWGRFVPEGGLMEGLTPGKAAPDADNDGMPDGWEKAHGLDPNDATDAVRTVPAGASENDRHKGYTYIEFYINERAEELIAQALADAEAAKDEPTSRPAPECPAAPAEIAEDVKVAETAKVAVPLAAGGGHVVALPPDGRLCAWGLNWHGELGDGSETDYDLPVTVKQPEGLPSLGDVVEISSAGSNIVALTEGGTLLAWGENSLGQVGLGAASDKQNVPAQVVGPDGKGALADIVTVSAGPYHTLAVRKDGTVWAWGCNIDGRLGDGSTTNHPAPVQVRGMTGAVAVAAGLKHSLALRRDGTVWAWGDNLCGQLGDGTNTDKLTPVRVKGLGGVTAIASGWFHGLALKSDGTVWSWGQNHLGQLGDGAETDRNTPTQVKGPDGAGHLDGVKRISAGGQHNLALRGDGTLWSWGWNYCSQIGDGTACWSKGTPSQVKGVGGDGVLKDIIAFDGGAADSVAVLKDGTLLSWGNNGRGQNGQGWTGSICVMDGKFIDATTFAKQRLDKKGALKVFGAPWPVKVRIGKSPVQVYADNLENGEPWLRVRSALNLASMGTQAVEAVPSLIKAMADEVQEVRQHSAWALGRIGPAARDALPALKKALPDSEGRVRGNIEDAIKKIEAKEE